MTPIPVTQPATDSVTTTTHRPGRWALAGFLVWLLIYLRLPWVLERIPRFGWPDPLIWVARVLWNPSLIMNPGQISVRLVGLVAAFVQVAWAADVSRYQSGVPGPRRVTPRAFVFGAAPLVALFLAFYSLLAVAFGGSGAAAGFLARLWLAVALAAAAGLALGKLTRWLRTIKLGFWVQLLAGSVIAIAVPLALLALNPAWPDGDYFAASMTAVLLAAQAVVAG